MRFFCSFAKFIAREKGVPYGIQYEYACQDSEVIQSINSVIKAYHVVDILLFLGRMFSESVCLYFHKCK